MFKGTELYETIRADLSFKDLTKILPKPRYSEKKKNNFDNEAQTKLK